MSISCTKARATTYSPIALSTLTRRVANSTGSIPSGAASLLASARRSRIWPQRETMGCVVPASTARTSPAGCFSSEAEGRPPSPAPRTPTRSIERRAAGGISNLGLRPRNSSSSSVDMSSSSCSVGRSDKSRFAPDGAASTGRGWTISPDWLAVGCGVLPWVGAGARLGCGAGAGLGLGAGSSKPGGSKSTGASCAQTIADVSASAAPPINHADFIVPPPAHRSSVRWGVTVPHRRRSTLRSATPRTAQPIRRQPSCRS